MEREPKRIEALKDAQRRKGSDPLLSLEVRNELIIPPVKSADKSGCGQCG